MYNAAPFVTVLIDTHNYGHFIEEAIDSVLSQDFPREHMEILVIDDGSTDDTAERVRKYGDAVRYLYKPNGGQASAFNFGFARARGDIIALLDADDTWLPGKMQRIAEEFERHPRVGMIYHPYIEIDMKTGTRREAEFRAISGSLFENKDEFFWYQAPCPASASFRRSSLAQIMPIPEKGLRTQADGYIGLLIAFVAPVLAIPEFLSTYRIHGKNLYHASEGQASPEFLKNRTEVTGNVLNAVHKWLRMHGYGWDMRFNGFVGRLTLGHERYKFDIKPPSRLRYFWFIVIETYRNSEVLTWKGLTLSYLSALLALIFGFKRADAVQKWRTQVLSLARCTVGRILPRRSGEAPVQR